MNDETVGGVHWSFWAIGAVALIWNVMGVINFFVQMNADALASFPESHRAIVEGRPAWATGAFAIAVFGGALGCLLLLLRKSAAYYLFIASLLGVIVQLIHTRLCPESCRNRLLRSPGLKRGFHSSPRNGDRPAAQVGDPSLSRHRDRNRWELTQLLPSINPPHPDLVAQDQAEQQQLGGLRRR